MLTSEQLQSIMPGLSAKKNGELLPFLQAAMQEFGIDAPARAAAFLAQLAHESGQFRFMEEIWGPTPAQRRYDPPGRLADALGNTEPGDGRRFKGRGPIQITGRANYRRFGELLGVELVSDPAPAAGPELAFRIAALFWSKKGLNELADRANADAFREITRRINGGFNGLAERQKFYRTARTVLAVAEPPLPREREPLPAEEPAFERGYEAIRGHERRQRTRKPAPGTSRARTRSGRKIRGVATAARTTGKTGAPPPARPSPKRAKPGSVKRSAAAASRKSAGARRRTDESGTTSRGPASSKSSRRKR